MSMVGRMLQRPEAAQVESTKDTPRRLWTARTVSKRLTTAARHA